MIKAVGHLPELRYNYADRNADWEAIQDRYDYIKREESYYTEWVKDHDDTGLKYTPPYFLLKELRLFDDASRETDGHFWKYLRRDDEPRYHKKDLQYLTSLSQKIEERAHFLDHYEQFWRARTYAFQTIADEFRPLETAIDPRGPEYGLVVVPAWKLLVDVRASIDRIANLFLTYPFQGSGLFRATTNQLHENMAAIARRTNQEYEFRFQDRRLGGRMEWPRPLLATETNLSDEEIVHRFLEGSILLDLFMKRVGVLWFYEHRFSHTQVIGGNGSGKSTLLENLIVRNFVTTNANDISTSAQINDANSNNASVPLDVVEREVDEEDRFQGSASLVVIDPHSSLTQRLAGSVLFGLARRTIVINPADMASMPAVNVFAIDRKRLATYGEAEREKALAGIVDVIEYVLSGLLDTELTGKQTIAFRHLARLLMVFPEALGRNATMYDMLALVKLDVRKLKEHDHDYLAAIELLPTLHRQFFQDTFYEPSVRTFNETKEQLRYRLEGLLENPFLGRFFASTENSFDLYGALNAGVTILIDTAEHMLKQQSSVFGRIWLALIMQAILERVPIPEKERHPTYIYVDEAGSYFDDRLARLLREARKFNAGVTLAYHELHQSDTELRGSIATNTITKFVGRVSSADARELAPQVRASYEDVFNLPKHHFAMYIADVTPRAVSISLPPHPLLDAQMRPDIFEVAKRLYWGRDWIKRRDDAQWDDTQAGGASPPPPPSPRASDDDISSVY